MLNQFSSTCFNTLLSPKWVWNKQCEHSADPEGGCRFCSSIAQVCVAAVVGEGEVDAHGVFFPRDSTQRGEDAALLVQNHTEISWKNTVHQSLSENMSLGEIHSKNTQNKPSWLVSSCPGKQSFSVLFLSFASFKCCSVTRGGVLTFLSHGSAGQTSLARRTLHGESDAIQRWDGRKHTGVTEEGNWRTDTFVKNPKKRLRVFVLQRICCDCDEDPKRWNDRNWTTNFSECKDNHRAGILIISWLFRYFFWNAKFAGFSF